MPSAQDFVRAYAQQLGVTPPSPDEFAALLDLAGVAAHASQRVAAPISCWLAALAGVPPQEGLDAARTVARSLQPAAVRRVDDAVRARLDDVAGRPLLVAIDGRGGAGKSTFAAGLAVCLEDVGSVVVAGDDFYRGQTPGEEVSPDEGADAFFDGARLRRDVLDPARAGAPRLAYRRHDWAGGGGLVDGPDVAMPRVVVVEGVTVLRAANRDRYDLTVWIDTPDGERQRRQDAREENSDAEIARWAAAEAAYVAQEDPAAAADLVVRGDE